jgi:hypothetical protein
MDFKELYEYFNLDKINVRVTLIKPIRNGEEFKTGRITGYKAGLYGGGWYNYKDGVPQSFNSTRIHCKKKERIQITYGVWQFHGKELSDWVDIDNCEFEIIQKDTKPISLSTIDIDL